MEKDLEENTEFRIKWPRGEMGSLPADSEQFMMLEDLYKTTDKINKHIESMMNNRINIEFLQKQMDKVLSWQIAMLLLELMDSTILNKNFLYKQSRIDPRPRRNASGSAITAPIR